MSNPTSPIKTYKDIITPVADFSDDNRYGHDYKWLLEQAQYINKKEYRDSYLKELHIANKLYEAGKQHDNPALMAEGAMKAYAYFQHYVKRNPSYLAPILAKSYKEYPVDIRTFVEHDEYLGYCGIRVWPAVMKKLQEMNRYPFTTDVGVREVLMGGCIGWGKSFCAGISILYTLYLLNCLEDISVLYPQRSTKPLAIFISAVNLAQAKNTTLDSIIGWYEASAWFKKNTRRYKLKSTSLELTNMDIAIDAIPAMRQKLVGHDVIDIFVDEVNQMEVIQSSVKNKGDGASSTLFDQAENFVSEALTRYESRFGYRKDQPIPKIGSIKQGSSANYIGDFLDKKFKRQDEMQDPSIVTCKMTLWEAKPKENYCGDTFKFLLGNNEIDPRVIDSSCIEGLHYPKGARVLDVPIEHYSVFREDPIKGQREFIGLPTSTSNKLFENPSLILSATNKYNDRVRQNLEIRRALRDLNVSFGDMKKDDILFRDVAQRAEVSEEFLYNTDLHIGYLLNDNVNYLNNGMLTVNLNNLPMDLNNERYIHVDLSKTTDRTGLACAKVIDFQHNTAGEVVPIFMVEWAASIQPSREAPLEPSVVRKFIQELKNTFGLNIKKVTYDSVSSTESIELLKKSGIDSGTFSVDTNLIAYTYLKDAMADGRVILHSNPILVRELTLLEYTKSAGHEKIDHPAGSGHSKDLSDCIAGAIYTASKARSVRSGLSVEGNEPRMRRSMKRQQIARRSIKGQRL